MVAMHSSPTQAAGTGDSGGMSVLLLALAGELAGRGIKVDLLARASGTPRVRTIAPGVTVHNCPPAAPVCCRRESWARSSTTSASRLAALPGSASMT